MFSVTSPFLIVGLGNPGAQYERTRHNFGVLAVDELCQRNYSSFSVHKRSNAMVSETRIAGQRVVLAKPRTFMNLSGGPVKALAGFFKVPNERVIVLFDDLELPFGETRLRPGGGDHGHNGLRSVSSSLGKDYVRCGIGIGRPPGRMDVASFVLKPFSKKEWEEVPIICADVADAVEAFVAERSAENN